MNIRKVFKEMVDLVKLVGSLGGELGPHEDYYAGHSPLHRRDGLSFAIHPESGEYECLECGAKGDALDFLTNVVGLSCGEAQDWLAEEFKIPIQDLRNIEIHIDPAIRKLWKGMPQKQLEDDVYTVLVKIARCHLGPDLEIQCCEKIQEVTGISSRKLKAAMQNATNEAYSEEYAGL
jgi:DNA primase